MTFDHAAFYSGTVRFANASFSGASVGFDRAKFGGASVVFDRARMTEGSVTFVRAAFLDGTIDFSDSEMTCAVSFRNAKVDGAEILFTNVSFLKHPGGTLYGPAQVEGRIIKLGPARQTVRFELARFESGLVDFTGSGPAGRRPEFTDDQRASGVLRLPKEPEASPELPPDVVVISVEESGTTALAGPGTAQP